MVRKLFLVNLKGILRDRGNLAFLLLFPLAFAVFFGSLERSTVKPMDLGIVHDQRDSVSADLVRDLKRARAPGGDPLFETEDLADQATARSRLEEGTLDAALIIPVIDGGGVVTLLYDEKSFDRQQRAIPTVNAVLQHYNLKLAGGTQMISLRPRGLRARAAGPFTSMIPFLLLFSVVMSSLQFGVARVVRYREQGVFKRLIVTPLLPRDFLIAEVMTRVVIASLQAMLVLGIGILAFDAELGPAAVWLLATVVVGSIVLMNIGMFFTTVSKSPEATSAIVSMVSWLLIILGGGLPETFLPESAAKVLGFLPIGPMNAVMRAVIFDRANPFVGAARESLILLAWLVISGAAAVAKFRFVPPSKKKKQA